MNLNLIQLAGRLGADPELKYLPSGSAVVNAQLATTERWTGNDGQKQERTEWHRLTVYGKVAENFAKYLRKGSQVYVQGSMTYRTWEDKDGQKRTTAEVKVQDFQFLDPRPSEARQDTAPPQGNSRMGGTPQGVQRGPQGPSGGSAPPRDWSDDVPFTFVILAPIAGYLAQFIS